MNKKSSITLLLLFLVTLAPQVSAQAYRIIKLTCPVCGLKIEGHEPSPPSGTTIKDKDLFTFYNGIAFYGKNISLCIRCGYASYNRGFQKKVDRATKSKIQDLLGADTQKYLKRLTDRYKKFDMIMDQDEIPSSVKYNNILRTYEVLKLSNIVMGKLYLERAWHEREIISTPLVMKETNAALVSLNQKLKEVVGFKEIKKLTVWIDKYEQVVAAVRDGTVKYCCYIAIASSYDRLGNYDKALTSIRSAQRIVKSKKLKSIAVSIERHLNTERVYQKKAIAYFRAALKESGVKKSEIPLITYLVGELYRRIGEGGRAKLWFKAVKQMPSADLALLNWSKEQYISVRASVLNDPADVKFLGEVITMARNEGVMEARKRKLIFHLKLCKSAAFLFRVDTDKYPDSLDDLVKLKYIKNEAYIKCPITGEPFLYFKPRNDKKSKIFIGLRKALPPVYKVRNIYINPDGEVVNEVMP